jgi:hypothetical protein
VPREKLAVVWSRKGADLQSVEGFLWDLHRKHPDWVVVSGGADGVDDLAERTWQGLGHEVESYRPVKLERGHGWGIERHHWAPGTFIPDVRISTRYPSLGNRQSAIWLRSWIIATEECGRLAAFLRPGGSRGSAFTVELASVHLGPENVRVFGGEELSGFGTMAGNVDWSPAGAAPDQGAGAEQAQGLGEVVRAPGLDGEGWPDEGGVRGGESLGTVDSPWRRDGPLVRKSGLNNEETLLLRKTLLHNLESAMTYGFRVQAARAAGLDV